MVTDYKKQCGYSVGTLKDFIYLIPYNADRFAYSIDNGMCSEVAMNSNNGIVRIDGFQTTQSPKIQNKIQIKKNGNKSNCSH